MVGVKWGGEGGEKEEDDCGVVPWIQLRLGLFL